MWLINVVLIVTFLYFIINEIRSINKENKLVIILSTVISIFFEIIFIYSNLTNMKLNTLLEVLILLFAYIVPIFAVIFYNTEISFKLKLLYVIASISYSLKKYNFAAGLLDAIIKNDRNNAKLYILRAKALEKLNDYKSARDMLFNVIELDKKNKVAYIRLVELLDMENKKDTALVILSSFLKIYPDDTDANELLGIIYSEMGREREAENIYLKLSEDNKGSYKTYYNLGIIYSKEGNIEKAIEAYKTAIEKNNKLYEAYYALGKLLYVNKDYMESEIYLKTALKDTLIKDKVEFALSLVYIEEDKLEKAVEHLEKAVKIDKTYLYKAKENPAFQVIELDIKRMEDDLEELQTYVYDVKENA